MSDNPLDRQVGGGHYTKYRIQPKQFYHANKVPALESQAIDYILRHGDKGGEEDLHKAIHILEILIYLEYTCAEPRPSKREPTQTTLPQTNLTVRQGQEPGERSLLHILQTTFDRHEFDKEKNNAGDIVEALRADREHATADWIVGYLSQNQMNDSVWLQSLFDCLSGGPECKECGG